MKKLEDIPKNHPFKVPDDYFDRLPGIIQARIAQELPVKETKPYFRYALQYALPLILVAVLAWVYLLPKQQNVESMLASITTEEMVAYLEQSDLTTDDLLENTVWDTESVEAVESEVYFNFDDDDLDNINEFDIDLDNL